MAYDDGDEQYEALGDPSLCWELLEPAAAAEAQAAAIAAPTPPAAPDTPAPVAAPTNPRPSPSPNPSPNRNTNLNPRNPNPNPNPDQAASKAAAPAAVPAAAPPADGPSAQANLAQRTPLPGPPVAKTQADNEGADDEGAPERRVGGLRTPSAPMPSLPLAEMVRAAVAADPWPFAPGRAELGIQWRGGAPANVAEMRRRVAGGEYSAAQALHRLSHGQRNHTEVPHTTNGPPPGRPTLVEEWGCLPGVQPAEVEAHVTELKAAMAEDVARQLGCLLSRDEALRAARLLDARVPCGDARLRGGRRISCGFPCCKPGPRAPGPLAAADADSLVTAADQPNPNPNPNPRPHPKPRPNHHPHT